MRQPDQLEWPPSGRHLSAVPSTPEALTPPTDSDGGVFISEAGYETEIVELTAPTCGTQVNITVERPIGAPEDSYKKALMLLHGYGGIETAYEDVRGFAAARGLTAVTWTPTRNQPLRSMFRPDHLLNPYKQTTKCAWGVMRCLLKKEELGIEQFHLAGHSMGGQTAAELAAHKSEHILTLILMAAAGMEEGLNTLRFIPRVGRFATHEGVGIIREDALRSKDPRKAAREIGNYVFRNPILTIGEMLSVSNSNIRPALQVVRDAGVPVASYQFSDDSLLPPQDVDEIVDLSILHPDASVGHTGPQVRHQEVGQQILDIIEHFHPRLKLQAV